MHKNPVHCPPTTRKLSVFGCFAQYTKYSIKIERAHIIKLIFWVKYKLKCAIAEIMIVSKQLPIYH